MKTNLKMFDDKGQIADFDGLRLAAGNRPGAWGLTAADGAGRVRLRWELDDDRVVVNGGRPPYGGPVVWRPVVLPRGGERRARLEAREDGGRRGGTEARRGAPLVLLFRQPGR